MVGVAGFEPATSWSQTKRSTKLSHTPMEPDTRYARVTEGYKSPVLLIKLIWHINKFNEVIFVWSTQSILLNCIAIIIKRNKR